MNAVPQPRVECAFVRLSGVSAWRVGGLGLEERWRKSLAAHGIGRVVTAQDAGALKLLLRGAEEPVLLGLADHVVEHLALEEFVEVAPRCADDAAQVLTAPGLPVAPALVLGPGAARRLADAAEQDGAVLEGDAAGIVAALRGLGVAVDERALPAAYWGPVRDASEAKAATWGLLQRLQWRPGGVVAKWINRPLSLRMSRHLLESPITPNQTTLFAFLVGALGVYYVWQGGWANVVLGTALLQTNSVLDGIDGELARIRHQNSEFGAYLDSVCDEVLNAALLVAAGHELSVHVHGGNPTYWWLGLVAASGAFLHALVHWHCKWRHGLGFYWWFEAYKPRKQVQRSTSWFAYFKKLFWKESYLLLFFLAALADVVEGLMWPSAVAGAVVWALLFVHVAVKRARW